jgi:hypothetical protein
MICERDVHLDWNYGNKAVPIYSTLCLIQAATQVIAKAKVPAAQAATPTIGVVSTARYARLMVYMVTKAMSTPLINSIHTDALIIVLKTGGITPSF